MTTQELTITAFDPATATVDDWTPLHAYRDAIFKESNADDPMPLHDLREQQMKMMLDNPRFVGNMRIARDTNNDIIGTLLVGFARKGSPDYETAKIMAFATLDTHKDYRQQGVGTQLLTEIIKACQEEGEHVRLVQGSSETPAGHAFVERYGGTVAMAAKENRLYETDIDWDMVRQWHEESSNRTDGVTIETFVGLPPEDTLQDYADFYTEVVNQVPMGEIEGAESTHTPETLREQHARVKETGTIWTTMITREADGTISGLTETLFNPKRPHRVAQELTGVRDAYRGRGLGKWLKTAMLLYVQEHSPEMRFVTTGNADSNAPMLSINDRLGFKPYKEQRIYKLEVATVAEKLGL